MSINDAAEKLSYAEKIHLQTTTKNSMFLNPFVFNSLDFYNIFHFLLQLALPRLVFVNMLQPVTRLIGY